MYYNKKERLQIVLDICKKLKNYKLKDGNTINLYNENLCEFITEFKAITREYINQEEDNLKEFAGKLSFTEIGKTIEYILPIRNNKQPLFVIKMS